MASSNNAMHGLGSFGLLSNNLKEYGIMWIILCFIVVLLKDGPVHCICERHCRQ